MSTAVAGHTLLLGTEYQRNQRIDQNIVHPDIGYLLRDRRDGYRAGLFVQDEWQITDAFASTLGLRADQIRLRMTRAEIGNHLGLTLETVSRALSRLARTDVIRFAEKGRREIQIPQVEALSEFIQRCVAPASTGSSAVMNSILRSTPSLAPRSPGTRSTLSGGTASQGASASADGAAEAGVDGAALATSP